MRYRVREMQIQSPTGHSFHLWAMATLESPDAQLHSVTTERLFSLL